MSKNINIEIPDEIHKKIKILAVKEDKTLKQKIIDLLKE